MMRVCLKDLFLPWRALELVPNVEVCGAASPRAAGSINYAIIKCAIK
jgi:hypothetical protein